MKMSLLFLPLFLFAFPTPSSGSYCICKDGLSDQVLQKAMDYACGAGADCTPIRPNGQCYNPNTIVNHCSYAVNNYFQKKSSTGATCDFGGVAQISTSPPSGSCLASGSTGSGSGSSGTGTTGPITAIPSTSPSTSTTPISGGTTTTNPASGGSSGTGGIGTGGTGVGVTGTPTSSGGDGMAPTGSSMNESGGVTERASLGSILATVLVSGIMFWWN